MKDPLKLKIRRAGMDDSEFLFRLRNDPGARRFFFNTGEIGWEEHCSWLNRAIKSKDICLYIFDDVDNKACGQVRFDIKSEREAEISITVDPGLRGRGLGGKIIEKGISQFHREYPDFKIIVAYIKPSNIASRKVFERSGFRYSNTEKVKGAEAEKWIYEIE